MEETQKRQRLQTDTVYSEGKKVLLLTKSTKPNRTGKFEPRFSGPHKIKRRVTPVSYEVDLNGFKSRNSVFGIDLLKKYHDET
jgi:hypothetical protein